MRGLRTFDIGGVHRMFLSRDGCKCTRSGSSASGIFDGRRDVGKVLHAGAVDYDAAKKTYTISGSGENMWLAADAFQFVWKKISGDVTSDGRHLVPDNDRK